MNQQELKHILSSKFDFEKWKDLLGTMFLKIDYLTKPIQIEADLVKSGGQVGMIRLDDGRSLGLFKFEVADSIKIARNRKGLRDIAIKYVDQDISHGALVFYYSEDQADYRLTFVSKQTSLNEDGEFVTKATAPKRYTFLLGENEPCTTASIRLLELINKKKSGSVYLADVTEAFSVERLNKDFFKGYKDQYGKFLNYIGEQSKANRDYVKKLLGRLVFLQFLQKKGWMGVPASNTNWEGGDKNYLNNLIEQYKDNNRLLSDVLEVLFFNTLNEKRDNDLADKILGENIKIPYLNGGLFDKDGLDKLDIDFPYDYFKELMEFFAMYNFTIDENDPDDAEVGVDPEMLGHIFENLLEDNKDKGAFYTPKEIVQYMSQESIAQYLKTHTEEPLHTAIEGLIKERKVDEALQNKASASKVYDLLRDVKVCDPAIGSGAFPMGVLNVLYHSRQVLYGFTKSVEAFSPAAVKREIIQNNIYGVDIEQGAIDIARLRFWLALVVDELKPEPLPNLDYKIMQGNSLLESFEGLDMSRIAGRSVGRPSNSPQLIIGLDSDLNRKNLQKLMRQYFSTDDHTAKAELRQTINNEVKSLIRNSLGGTTTSLNHLEQLDCSANSDFFLWHTWFKDVFDNGGFDVVIGNPPYVNVQLMTDEEKTLYRNHYAVFFKRCDLFALFVELGLSILSTNDGIVTFIIPSVVHSNMSYTRLRDLILNHHWLKEVCYTGGDVFNAPTVDTTILICNKKGNQDIMLKNAVNFAEPITKTVPADYFATFNNVISVGGDNDTDALYSKLLNDDFEKVDAHYNVFQGIVTGNNTAFIFENEDEALAKGIEKALLHPLCHGRDIEKYMVRSHDRRILYIDSDVDIEDYPKTKKWLMNFKEALDKRNEGKRDIISWCSLHRPRVKSELDLKEKILLQNTRNEALKTRIAATLDDTGIYGTQGLNFIIPKDKQANLHYLLGILNSKPINYLFATKFLNLAIKAEYVKQIRIPAGTPAQRQAIVALVDGILSTKKGNPQADTREMEQEIDLLVFKLYGLNYEEMLTIDSETPITREEYQKS